MTFITGIESEIKVDITFYSKDINVVNGVPQEEAWTEVKTVKGLFWTGAKSLGLVSDKLKTSVEGAIAIDYDSDIEDLNDNSRFEVNDKYYRIIGIDNPGMQNEILQITYKRELSN